MPPPSDISGGGGGGGGGGAYLTDRVPGINTTQELYQSAQFDRI